MSRTNALSDMKLPERITSSVRSAKKRSTRLSQDELVGVKCILKRGCRSSQVHLRVLVGSIVIGDEVQIEVLRCLAVDLLEKAQPLDVGIVRLSSRDQFAFENAERGKQCYCAVARIIVRHGARMPGCERQPELGTLERLALALLIAAQHQRLGRRIEIEPDHVPELLLEFWIVRELECLGDVRFQIVLRPDALHRAGRDADMAAHAAHAPAAPALRWTRGLGDDAGNLGLGQGWLTALATSVRQAVEPCLLEPRRPDRDRPHRWFMCAATSSIF